MISPHAAARCRSLFTMSLDADRERRQGEPNAMKPTVSQVLPVMRAFQRIPGNEVGGLLHVVLDDGNVEDVFVEECLREAEKEGDEKAAELARLLLEMSFTQRRKLAALFYAEPTR